MKEFLNKQSKLTYHSGFVIDGKVIKADDNGVIFQTATQTAFISWASIRDIKLVE